MRLTKLRSTLVSDASKEWSCFWVVLSVVCFCVAASSGTVTINADSTVQILAEEAYPLDMLDVQVHMLIT